MESYLLRKQAEARIMAAEIVNAMYGGGAFADPYANLDNELSEMGFAVEEVSDFGRSHG